MLDSAKVVRLFHKLEPWVTDAIWIGKMNDIARRVSIRTKEDRRRVEAIEAGQTDERTRQIYAELKHHPKVKWKDSIKEVLGLKRPDEAGLDV